MEREEETFLIRFSWTPVAASFSEVVEHCGRVPLPPYIRRQEEFGDKTSYQTIYAREEGSVAAPTAGLHFTEEVLKSLQLKDIERLKVTLHTGAGTFKPVSSETLAGHVMHTEKIQISKRTIQRLLQTPQGLRVAVGTTTVRTLESLYWFGVKLLHLPPAPSEGEGEGSGGERFLETEEFFIDQWEATSPPSEGVGKALKAVLDYMERKNIEQLYGATKLIITPDYRIRMADVLITNFHQPQSTLLLLVAAFIGDEWKNAYEYALSHDFRFLSYGDACLFFSKS
jgi:S-adenosylmethionine:tRNA ribosyltransferase-isomerase